MTLRRFSGIGLSTIAVALLAAQGAWGQDAQANVAKNAPDGFFALGVATLPEFIGADANQLVPFAAASVPFLGRRFNLAGLGANVDLLPNSRFSVGPLVNLELGRDDGADSEVLARMSEIDPAIEVGGFLRYAMPVAGLQQGLGAISLQVRQDVAGGHEGLVVQGGGELGFSLSARTQLSLSTQLTWADASFVDTYFAVDEADALASGLPLFDAGAGLRDVGAAVLVTHAVSQRWALIGRVAYTRLLGDAVDSPVVDLEGDANQLFIGGGVSWLF